MQAKRPLRRIKLYEDQALGRLPGDRFDKMYAGYEAEQVQLAGDLERLEGLLEEENPR